MDYSEDDEDILPNPDLVIEYDSNFNKETGKIKKDICILINYLNYYKHFLEKHPVKELIITDIFEEMLWNPKIHSTTSLKKVK